MPVPLPPTVRLMPLPDDQPRSMVAFVTPTPGLAEIRVRLQHRPAGPWWCCDQCARGRLETHCPHVTAVLAAVQKERNNP